MARKQSLHPRRIDHHHKHLSKILLNDKQPPPDHSISRKLWSNCLDLVNLALESDFIQGIKHGTLNPNQYGQYTVQDVAYCYHGTKDYQKLEQRAIESNQVDLAKFAKARLESYQAYYESEADHWHIEDPNTLKLSEAASWYIQAEENAVSEKYPPIYGIIAMIPCNQLWPWLANELKPSIKDSGVYSFWIDENSSFDSSYRLDNFINSWFAANPNE